MKKLEKEAVLRERAILISAVSFFIFILPYILYLAVYGFQIKEEEEFGQISQTIRINMDGYTQSLQLETYLLGAVAKHSEVYYEDETLKALAVIIRSGAVCAMIENRAVERKSFYTEDELRILWADEYDKNIQRYRDIIVSTRGIVIFYEGNIIEVPFHRLSCGTTRDCSVYNENLPYLTCVESPEDRYADEYISLVEVRKETVGEDFEILAQDRFGYVLLVKKKGETINGETFRQELALPSACFEYEEKENNYVFRVRGIGHGFGLSIYGADALAKKGWSFAEILEYYYSGIEIRKENRSDINA